jgi:hypothetical protein
MTAVDRLTLTPDQARRRRRRSVAIALVLAALVVLFYAMAIAHGPAILQRPL